VVRLQIIRPGAEPRDGNPRNEISSEGGVSTSKQSLNKEVRSDQETKAITEMPGFICADKEKPSSLILTGPSTKRNGECQDPLSFCSWALRPGAGFLGNAQSIYALPLRSPSTISSWRQPERLTLRARNHKPGRHRLAGRLDPLPD